MGRAETISSIQKLAYHGSSNKDLTSSLGGSTVASCFATACAFFAAITSELHLGAHLHADVTFLPIFAEQTL